MSERLTLDVPLNRVEGDLDVQVTLEEGTIVDAACVGTLYRGFENMLRGRDAMDALVITPRICGICSVSHLTAAVKAIEQAADITPPPQAVRFRNVSLMAETVQSDLRQVFLMFMADFAHDFYRDHDFHAEAVAQYAPLRGEGCIEALRMSKDIVKIVAIIGGQWPHTSHMVPGGICTLPSLMDLTLALQHLQGVSDWYQRRVLGCGLSEFAGIDSAAALQAHVEAHSDTHLARFLRMSQAAGLDRIGRTSAGFLSYGAIDEPETPSRTRLRAGVVYRDTGYMPLDPDAIREDLSHAWYKPTTVAQHPFEGLTEPFRQQEKGYSWAKAPRYDGRPMQTGPLAEAVVAGQPLFLDLVEQQGDSALVRELARLLRPALYLEELRIQLEQILRDFDQSHYEAPDSLRSGRGVGTTSAARGALGHWLIMEAGRIIHYQIVTPTAWNAAPLDQEKQHGPWEEALIGLRLGDPDNPMEMGHVIRSFDPCLVCTVHALGETGQRDHWRFGP